MNNAKGGYFYTHLIALFSLWLYKTVSGDCYARKRKEHKCVGHKIYKPGANNHFTREQNWSGGRGLFQKGRGMVSLARKLM